MSMTAEEQYHHLDPKQVHDALQRLMDGDFSVRMPTEWTGRAGIVASVFNALLTKLEELSSEHVRVADEIGKEGRLGGWAEVHFLSGRWRAMLDSLNHMSAMVTDEVRRVNDVAKAWADGDASKRLAPALIPGEFGEMSRRLDAAAERWTGGPSK